MKAAIETKNGKSELVLRFPFTEASPSSSGKMLLIANTGGFQETNVDYQGKKLRVSCNAGVYAQDKKSR